MNLAQQHGILVLEDAAPAFGAELRGRFVGAIGDAGFVSFGSSKVIAGEKGGALLTNNDDLARKVECFIQRAACPEGNLNLFFKAAARKLVLSSWCFPLTKFCFACARGRKDVSGGCSPYNNSFSLRKEMSIIRPVPWFWDN